jgi:hypothetical protein
MGDSSLTQSLYSNIVKSKLIIRGELPGCKSGVIRGRNPWLRIEGIFYGYWAAARRQV